MRYKITILDTSSGAGEFRAEIIETSGFPMLNQLHYLQSGGYGLPVKVELIMEAYNQDTVDTTVES